MFKKLAAMLLGILLVVGTSSCTKEQRANSLQDAAITKSAITDYLDDVYTSGYSIGTVIYTTDATSRTYAIHPVTPTGDTRARGYLATDSISGDLVYFADVDRTNHVLSTEDIDLEEEEDYEDIDEWDDYEATNDLDFIEIIGDHNDDPIAGRKFWGWGDWQDGPCEFGTMVPYRVYHVFFFPTSRVDYGTVQPC